MPKTPAIDVSVRPLPREISELYGRIPEYRHIFKHIFNRESVLDNGIPTSEMMKEMGASNIQSILVSGADSRSTNGLYVENDWVARLAEAHPERVIPGIGVDPLSDIMKSVMEIRRCAEQHNFAFTKLFPYAVDLLPHDRRFYPIYAVCCELGLPIWTQVGHTAGLMPSEPGRPIYLDRVALDFPELKIIGGHIGWPWHEEMIAMALKHPNVYISTCGHAPEHWPESFVKFLKTRGKRKVIFGSNWPYISYERYFRNFATIGLTEEIEHLFLRGNLLEVLDIEDQLDQNGTGSYS